MTRLASTLSAGSSYPLFGMSLMAFLVSVTPACTLLQHVDADPTFETADDELAVLTFNVYGFPLFEELQRPERFSDILHELRSRLRDVDVVMLQEAFIPSTRVLREARLHAFGGACGKEAAFNPTGLVLLSDHDAIGSAASFAFLEGDDGAWSMRAEDELDCDALAKQRGPLKGVMSLTLSTPHGPVDVVNVHLDVKPEARRAQKRLLSDYLAQREGHHPLVLAGDLNEETCAPGASGPFPGAVDLEGASCGVGPTVGGLRWGMLQGALFPAEIDSVYVCGAAPTEKRTRLFTSPRRGGHLSDHDAVLALVRISRDRKGPVSVCH